MELKPSVARSKLQNQSTMRGDITSAWRRIQEHVECRKKMRVDLKFHVAIAETNLTSTFLGCLAGPEGFNVCLARCGCAYVTPRIGTATEV